MNGFSYFINYGLKSVMACLWLRHQLRAKAHSMERRFRLFEHFLHGDLVLRENLL